MEKVKNVIKLKIDPVLVLSSWSDLPKREHTKTQNIYLHDLLNADIDNEWEMLANTKNNVWHEERLKLLTRSTDGCLVRYTTRENDSFNCYKDVQKITFVWIDWSLI